jgi:hypothetical protein
MTRAGLAKIIYSKPTRVLVKDCLAMIFGLRWPLRAKGQDKNHRDYQESGSACALYAN